MKLVLGIATFYLASAGLPAAFGQTATARAAHSASGVSAAETPYLGVSAADITTDRAKALKLKEVIGVEVTQVEPDSAAAKAGLKVGDVITTMDGERIRGASELREKLLTKREQKTIKLGILRNKTQLSLTVELPQHKEEPELSLSERTNI